MFKEPGQEKMEPRRPRRGYREGIGGKVSREYDREGDMEGEKEREKGKGRRKSDTMRALVASQVDLCDKLLNDRDQVR